MLISLKEEKHTNTLKENLTELHKILFITIQNIPADSEEKIIHFSYNTNYKKNQAIDWVGVEGQEWSFLPHITYTWLEPSKVPES